MARFSIAYGPGPYAHEGKVCAAVRHELPQDRKGWVDEDPNNRIAVKRSEHVMFRGKPLCVQTVAVEPRHVRSQKEDKRTVLELNRRKANRTKEERVDDDFKE